MPHVDASQFETLCQGLLANAGARHLATSSVEPESPSADYRTGFAAGWEAGQLSALALVVGALTDQSPTQLVEETLARASVDSAFPFELYVEPTPEGVA